MDLFDQRAPIDDSDGQYGLSGEMKKTQYVLQLLGAPWCVDTLACILAAAEQGMEMTCGLVDTSENEQNSSDFLAISEFGVAPVVKELDYIIPGVRAITEFINARGLGNTLIPMNAVKASDQDCWIEICRTQATPAISTLVAETVCSDSGDAGKIADAKNALVPVLDMLNDALGKEEFIVGKYSLADIYWTAAIHLLSLTSAADMIAERSNIKNWCGKIMSKKSACGQNVVAASFLPTAADIKAKKLPPIIKIEDF